MIDHELLTRDAVFRVGEVVGIQGRTVRIRVDKAKNGAHLIYRGRLLRNVGVGGYLKITKGFAELVAKVDGEEVAEARGGDAYRSSRDRVERILTVSLIGFMSGGHFRRGVRELPLVGNESFLLDEDEFDRIHSFVDSTDRAVTIGQLAMEHGQDVRVGVNALFASHIGIFGNTGSGKSYTLTKLYHELFAAYGDSQSFKMGARVLLMDFNGEYVNRPGAEQGECNSSVLADNELKTQFILSTRTDDGDRLPLNKVAMEDPVIWTVLLDATEKTQAPFVQRTLQSNYWETKLETGENLASAVAGIVYAAIRSSDPALDKGLVVKFLEEVEGCMGQGAPHELNEYIRDIQSHLGYHSMSKCFYYRAGGVARYANDPNHDSFFQELTYTRIGALGIDPSALQDVDRIRFKLVLQYYSDIFNGYANREHLGPLIKRLESRMPRVKRLIKVSDEPLLDKPLTVISLRDVNVEMRKVIPLLICRQLYDEKKRDADTSRYLNIVVDEAHNILSSASSRESEAWKDYRLETFEEIIKEGRKFGVFLTIASQRPHDISETIISQLHNYFLHRLVNNLDILAIERAVAYLDRVSFESLPILPTGSCVLSGISTQVPVVVDITRLPAIYEPNNRTMTLAGGWVPGADPSEGPVPHEPDRPVLGDGFARNGTLATGEPPLK
ncbi:ATP-binding protein [uncultured Serinicoccus sp.]|uniref:ATP-binding protein n=1 Tax=uncultured Serinicoccus sp. TaxID=735514 RepID=UPI002635D777|nr:ATP-binding protein [uncultured Serinicoccus sp.]